MTAEIVTIGSETLAEFITRHGGVANTSNIAQRFGWFMAGAYRILEEKARRGEIEKVPAHEWSGAGGRVCSWRLPSNREAR